MSLKEYLQKAYKEVRLTSEDDLGTFRLLEGTLSPERENLILVYGGSFNPPHKGHIDVILSGLRPELGAVALVILPSEDFHLRYKLTSSYPEFFLSRKRRAELLNAIDLIPKSKVWVWSNTWYPFKPFTEALVRLAKADGFKVAFSHMIGPDNLDVEDALDNYPYRFPRMLISNKARHVSSSFGSDGKPVKWKGFGDWSRNEVNSARANGISEYCLMWLRSCAMLLKPASR